MTVSLREEQAEWIESQMGENGEFESKSEVMRSLIDRHQELHEEIEGLLEVIEEITSESGEYESPADAMEELMNHHDTLHAKMQDMEMTIEDLHAEIEALETDIDRLQNEKQLILQQREENKELARYVEDELSYREASLGTRMKWWLFGKGSE